MQEKIKKLSIVFDRLSLEVVRTSKCVKYRIRRIYKIVYNRITVD